MANVSPFDPSDELAHEIDRLLKQLPVGEPIGRAAAAYTAPHVTRPVAANGSTLTAHAGTRRRAARAAGAALSPHAQLALVWTRVLLAAALGVALTQWPYFRACGAMLSLYLIVIGAVLIASGWAAVEAWRGRVAAAHMVALIIGFWGIVLAAEQVLPRVGYAAATAEWSCSAGLTGG